MEKIAKSKPSVTDNNVHTVVHCLGLYGTFFLKLSTKLRNTTTNLFFIGSKWSGSLHSVSNPYTLGAPTAPSVIATCSGMKENSKLCLANALLKDWIRKYVKVKNSEEGGYYVVSTQNMKTRTLFSELRSSYGWQIGQKDLKGFDGNFFDFVNGLYEARAKEVVSYCYIMHSILYSAALTIHAMLQGSTYGKVSEGTRLCEEDSRKVLENLSVFDESNLRQFQMKMIFSFGSLNGFRGGQEHSLLNVDQIKCGEYGPNSPFHEKHYIGYDGGIDKTHKLTLNQSYKRDTKMISRVPVSSGKFYINYNSLFSAC